MTTDYTQLNLEICAGESISKIENVLRHHGSDVKTFDWKRFMTWLNNAPEELLSKITIPSKPSKSPLNAVLTEHAGSGPALTYILIMYRSKWIQTKAYLESDIEKFVKMWSGTEYAQKKQWFLTGDESRKATEIVCENVIPQFEKWGLDRGPATVNSLFRILKNLEDVQLSATKDFKAELGALFLQSSFFDKDVRAQMARFYATNYIKVARALGIPEENVENMDEGYMIKVDAKLLHEMNAVQKAFIQIEDKYATNPKNKSKYVIHDLSVSPEDAILKAWKACLGTATLRPEAFMLQTSRIVPLLGSMEKLWELMESKPVMDRICDYIKDLGTPGLGLVLGSIVDYCQGQSISTRATFYHFLVNLNQEYANLHPNMVSPKATYYMMIIASSTPLAWRQYVAMLPRLQYVNKLPDMIDSERGTFNITAPKNLAFLKKAVEDVLLPWKDKLVWNDPRVLLMLLKSLGYEDFMKFAFSDDKIQSAYELLAKTEPKSPYLKLLASKNMKIRNEVFSNIQKRMSLGGLDPIKFCDPSRNLADLPSKDVPDHVQALFGKAFDNLKITQWRPDVLGSRDVYMKSDWMGNLYTRKIQERAYTAMAQHAHSPDSLAVVTDALPTAEVDKLLQIFPDEHLREALKSQTPKDTAQLLHILDNCAKMHHPALSFEAMSKLLDVIEEIVDKKQDKTAEEYNHQSAIRLAVCDIIGRWADDRKQDADRLFAHLKKHPVLREFAAKYFAEFSAVNVLVNLLNTSVIKPLTPTTPEQMRILMKFNNIELPTEKKVDVSKLETLDEILDMRNQAKLVWRDLHVEHNDLDEAELLERSIKLDKHNKYRHGDIAIKVVKEFKVDVPIQAELTAKWDEVHKDDEVMIPVFHGTGSVAASFILRFGFAVIIEGGGGVAIAGKMLGNGIYFSNVIDKAAQYASDSSFSRGKGNKGYIFEMRANLGKKGKDYNCAGVDGTDGIRSPEWCVFNPNGQLRIYKAYEIELTDKAEMRDMKGKYKTLMKDKGIDVDDDTDNT